MEMKQTDLSNMTEEMALLEEAGLQDMNWTKITKDLACFETEAQFRKMDTISNLDPAKTALFLGMDTKSDCTSHEEREYRKQTQEVFHKLLDMDITTILVEDATIFGFFAIDELIHLRKKHEFTLMIIHRKTYKYSWVHSSDKEISHRRHLDSIHYYTLCDQLMGSISRAEWLDICNNHIAAAITEQPPYYCNLKVMTAEQCNLLGCLDQNKTQELKRWLLRDDERMMLFAK